MSGLQTIAAVIGITDVAIRAIRTSHERLEDLREAPEDISQLRQETGAVVQALAGLEFLQTADASVQEQAKRVGLAEAVNQCGRSCASLDKELDRWIGSGVNLKAKLEFHRHKAQIGKYLAQINTAKCTIALAINVASLAISVREQSAAGASRQRVTVLQQQISSFEQHAEEQRKQSAQTAMQLERLVVVDEDDLDAKLAITEVEKEKDAYSQLWADCIVAEEEMQTLVKINVAVGDMTADANSRNDAGVPKEVLKKVAYAKIKVGDMVARNGSVNRVGIF